MAYRNTHVARRMLSDLASTQGGYFTAKQAAGAGYGKRHLDYHVKAGNIERAGHGLYRLPTIPLSEHDDLIRLSLWSRNRHDEPQAVASHESALNVHGLGELLPSLIHLTVPPSWKNMVGAVRVFTGLSDRRFLQAKCSTRAQGVPRRG